MLFHQAKLAKNNENHLIAITKPGPPGFEFKCFGLPKKKHLYVNFSFSNFKQKKRSNCPFLTGRIMNFIEDPKIKDWYSSSFNEHDIILLNIEILEELI